MERRTELRGEGIEREREIERDGLRERFEEKRWKYVDNKKEE